MLVIAIVLGILLVLCLILSYICFRMAFYVSEKQKRLSAEKLTPDGEIYAAHREQMLSWIYEARKRPQREVFIKSFDGLTLRARFFEFAPGAPVELMFHGYRGTAERDLSGGVQRCFSLGRSVLLVDQRGACKSDGHVISFGVNESRDVKSWVDFLIKDQGESVKIILTGISMGATTVMIAAGRPLPKQVIGVIADCGFHSAKAIIKKVMRDMHLPAEVLYPFVKAGARIFGGFALEEATAEEAMKKCRLPVFLIHGEADDFVPCEMSKRLYEACAAQKYLFTVPGAGHGMGYLADTPGYVKALTEFSEKNGIPIGVSSEKQ